MGVQLAKSDLDWDFHLFHAFKLWPCTLQSIQAKTYLDQLDDSGISDNQALTTTSKPISLFQSQIVSSQQKTFFPFLGYENSMAKLRVWEDPTRGGSSSPTLRFNLNELKHPSTNPDGFDTHLLKRQLVFGVLQPTDHHRISSITTSTWTAKHTN